MLTIKNDNKYLAIAILIGGKSTRFGSDKGLYNFLGKPLITHQLETLNQGNYNIFLIANSKAQVQNYINKIDIKSITAFIVDDNSMLPNSQIRTPLKGLYIALKELKKLGYEKLLTLACDNPLIHIEVIEFLIEQSEVFDCCIPKWNNGFIEPLLAIYDIKKTLIKITENLKVSDLRLTKVLDKSWKINFISIETHIKPLDVNLLSFFNINELADIEKISRYKKNKKKI
ncbi:MAG: molybdenum cofactor guanylyltransferase [Promethearchaeota archaeon]